MEYESESDNLLMRLIGAIEVENAYTFKVNELYSQNQ